MRYYLSFAESHDNHSTESASGSGTRTQRYPCHTEVANTHPLLKETVWCSACTSSIVKTPNKAVAATASASFNIFVSRREERMDAISHLHQFNSVCTGRLDPILALVLRHCHVHTILDSDMRMACQRCCKLPSPGHDVRLETGRKTDHGLSYIGLASDEFVERYAVTTPILACSLPSQ